MRRVLLVAHSLPPDEHSGTPFTTLGYARTLARRGCEVTVLHASSSPGNQGLRPERRAGEAFARVALSRIADATEAVDWSLTAASRPLSPDVSDGIEHLLAKLDPDVVHVLNLVRLPLDIPELAKRQGLPVIRSVTGTEDLCGLVIPVSAVSPGRGVCEPPLSPAQCTRCVRDVAGAGRLVCGGRARRRRHRRVARAQHARAVHHYRDVFDRVIFPSAAFRVMFEQSLPLDATKVREIEMGMDLEPWGGSSAASARSVRTHDEHAPVTFVMASTKEVQKGISDVVDAFTSSRLASRHDWRLRFLGGGDASLVARLATDPRVEVGDAYDVDVLPQLLADADVGLSVSRSETFHRTTREYLLAGLPVLGTAVGGIPEVILDGWNGRILDRAEPAQLVDAVIELLDHPARLDDLRAAACATYVRPLDDEVADLLAVYEDVVTATVRP